ncbi:hypothetical protein RSAG8_03613, partial [Rhizoctonia solani AG-8 WAC10335]
MPSASVCLVVMIITSIRHHRCLCKPFKIGREQNFPEPCLHLTIHLPKERDIYAVSMDSLSNHCNHHSHNIFYTTKPPWTLLHHFAQPPNVSTQRQNVETWRRDRAMPSSREHLFMFHPRQ